MRRCLSALFLLLLPHRRGEANESYGGSPSPRVPAQILIPAPFLRSSPVRSDISYYSYYAEPVGSSQTPTSVYPCSHSECVVGGPLELGCDSCVTEIILNDTRCGDVYWNSSCVSKVFSVCGNTMCTAVNLEKRANDLGESVGWSVEIIVIVILVFFGIILGFACIARFGRWVFRPKTATVTVATLPIAAVAEESQHPGEQIASAATPVAAPCSSDPYRQAFSYTPVYITIDPS